MDLRAEDGFGGELGNVGTFGGNMLRLVNQNNDDDDFVEFNGFNGFNVGSKLVAKLDGEAGAISDLAKWHCLWMSRIIDHHCSFEALSMYLVATFYYVLLLDAFWTG